MSNKAQTPIADGKTTYLGAGAIYFNYGEVDEVCIGATKGGSTFTTNTEFRSKEQDGVYGEVKGNRRKIRVVPQLTVNALELTKDNLKKFFAGMDVDTSDVNYDKITERLDIQDSDYITNVAFVGENYDEQDIVIILENVLGDGSLEMAIAHEEDIVPEVQFTAHYDPSTPKKVPYEIRLYKGTTYTVTFTVDDGTNAIEGATIEFNGQSIDTDVTGQAVFTGVQAGTNLPYTITKSGYNTVSSSIDVSGDTNTTVSMTSV